MRQTVERFHQSVYFQLCPLYFQNSLTCEIIEILEAAVKSTYVASIFLVWHQLRQVLLHCISTYAPSVFVTSTLCKLSARSFIPGLFGVKRNVPPPFFSCWFCIRLSTELSPGTFCITNCIYSHGKIHYASSERYCN